MKTILLHLSDSHISDENVPLLQRHAAIAATLHPILPITDKLFIVYTGDIVDKGHADQFAIAKRFIDGLKTNICAEFTGTIEVITAPGNHDIANHEARKYRSRMIKDLRANSSMSIDEEVIEVCTEPLNNYYTFEKSLASSGKIVSHPLWNEHRFVVGETTVKFSAMNASWISTVPETQGELIFPIEQFAAAKEESADINILLLHHPLNWYAQASYHDLREIVKADYQIVMSGHEHTENAYALTDPEKRATIFFEAPALLSHKGDSSGFSVILLDLDQKSVAQEVFVWDGSMYTPKNAEANWEAFIEIPKPRLKNGFHLTNITREWLGSLDATFTHPLQENIRLSDVFVYPDLHDLDGVDKQDVVSAIHLLTNDLEHDRVLIYGDEQFGKSCLLKQWYLDYLSAGKKPLMFDAKVGAGNPEQFIRSLNRIVAEQYGQEAVNKYAQLPKHDKVALIDNLDAIGSRSDVLARAMHNIESQFGRIAVVSSERYEVMIMSSKEAAQAFSDFTTYRMMGFGYRLRHDLIRRWYEIGNHLDPQEFESRVHAADQAINSVLSKGLVPMTAFNTLVLLQTIEVNDRSSLANAGTAQYYEYMFRHSLIAAKVRADDFDEIQSYLVHLAWEFFKNEKKTITTDDLMQFNSWFSKKIHPTEPIGRLDLLEKTKILIRKDDELAFAYPYLEYFFVAKYLASYCDDQPELKDRIKHLCKHLYLKKNANIVLFLTHHMHSSWVIQEIADLLTSIMSDIPALRLEQDAETLNQWVTENTKVVVDTSNLTDNKREVRRLEDKAAGLPERMPEKEVSSIRELDQFAQLNLLFKTSEILGQVIKGRYGSTTMSIKSDLVSRLFDAPLRGINFFNSLINQAPEAMLLEASSHLQKKFPAADRDKIERVVKKLFFTTVGAVADTFLSRQGEIIGSPKLTGVVDLVAKNKGDLSYRIVAIASKLSYPGTPPIEEIKALAEAMDKNYFGYKLLQGLVARHLYMFHVSYNDRDRLAATVGIDVQTKRDIELKAHSTRKLPNGSVPHHTQQRPTSLLNKLQTTYMLQNQDTITAIQKRYVTKKPRKADEPNAEPPSK